jgi:hypothetical protein
MIPAVSGTLAEILIMGAHDTLAEIAMFARDECNEGRETGIVVGHEPPMKTRPNETPLEKQAVVGVPSNSYSTRSLTSQVMGILEGGMGNLLVVTV